MQKSRGSFTGRTRRHRNRWMVRLSDVVARWFITVGGIGTIVAVLLVFAFLLSVVLPLFWPAARLGPHAAVALRDAEKEEHRNEASSKDERLTDDRPSSERPAAVALLSGVNEYRTAAWALDSRGRFVVFLPDTGELVRDSSLWDEGEATAASWDSTRGRLAIGMQDGQVRLGKVASVTEFVGGEDEIPAAARNLAVGRFAAIDGQVYEATSQGSLRKHDLQVELGESLKVAEAAITTLDLLAKDDEDSLSSRGPLLAVGAVDGQASVHSTKQNAATGELRLDESARLAKNPTPSKVVRVLLTSAADNAWVVWQDGSLDRFDIRDFAQPRCVERVSLLAIKSSAARPAAKPEASPATVTACEWVLGRETLLVGDSTGGLNAWFRVRSGATESSANQASDAKTPASDSTLSTGDSAAAAQTEFESDGFELVRAHRLPSRSAAVTALAASPRSRLAAAGYSDGRVVALHVTTETRLAEAVAVDQEPVRQLQLTAKEDAIVASTSRGLVQFDLDARHPEATLAALFAPVWYEGYPEPRHVWQSSFAGVEPEMKLGLWPLVFGTLKATFYSLLFSAPIALLAALHTSEFMTPTLRSRIKPAIEMMASLPSVVLGFLAALVFAPVIEQAVAGVLTSLIAAPLAVLLAAHLWQLMPGDWGRRFTWLRLPAIVVALGLGVLVGFRSGPLVERLLFAGSVLRWLDGQSGDGRVAWGLLLLPLSAVLTTIVVGAWLNPWLRRRAGEWSRGAFAMLSLFKFIAGCGVTVAISAALACLAQAALGDPRGVVVDTYVQRNALIVGFVMGFAIIPLIYTLADDALSSVPQQLRAASLGAGATPWQTAVRVVVPTAMSGLFSALMIGLGRAVGETMVVLMSGGNTPITEWNPFNGFRTLSANIAVELPEAVRDSTHYRVLFLAALCLFVITFVVNTAAELVRIRFRKRAVAL